MGTKKGTPLQSPFLVPMAPFCKAALKGTVWAYFLTFQHHHPLMLLLFQVTLVGHLEDDYPCLMMPWVLLEYLSGNPKALAQAFSLGL